MIHDLNKDIDKSYDPKVNELLNNFYKSHFLGLKDIQIMPKGSADQKSGIDKKLIFESGKEVLVDEKIRWVWYPDILLEEYSVYDKKIVGWLSRKKHTDYIAYFKEPKKELFLFPFLLLQKTWQKNYKQWLEKFGRSFSPNEGWRSSNIGVPIADLYIALQEEMGLFTL